MSQEAVRPKSKFWRVVRITALSGLALLLVLLLIVGTRPDDFKIERSAEMKAPPAAVFSRINDFHNWKEWSPWEKLDPNMKRTYDGEPGKGAVYTWTGNDQVGEGRMTILESKPDEFVSIKLEFIKPFAATNRAIFTLVPSGEGTKVTWAMDGKNNLVAKAFHMIMDMDQLVGKDFEAGLASLDKASQAAAKDASAAEAKPETATEETASEAEGSDSTSPESP